MATTEHTYRDAWGVEFRSTGGICYATHWYREKADAERFAASVREEGRTANGGYFHGMPLGCVSEVKGGEFPWSVTC